MTPPGGSRDDDDGAPGDDPKLRAMRAVWLEMRDEDPPDRGLTDLLAAAHSKAAAMRPPPSAWQRLLAALRRPPVLALATVTVLIAGAVLLGRRVPREARPGLTASPDAAGPARSASRGSGQTAADHGGAPAAPVPQPAAPPPTSATRPPDPGIQPAPPTHSATTPSPSTAQAIEAPGAAPRNDGDRAAARASPAALDPAEPAPAPSSPENVTELGASAAVPAADPARGNPASGNTAGTAAGAAANHTTSDAANSRAKRAANTAANTAKTPETNAVAVPAPRPSPARPRPDADGDLSQQCEAAARRGDCATVRQLVDRISRADRGYRARVAKDSPVGKCLTD